jgi:hypothetical protein
LTRPVLSRRQLNFAFRSHSDFAFNFYGTLVGGDNVMNEPAGPACSDIRFLGCKKGNKNLLQNLFVHADAAILYMQKHFLPALRVRMDIVPPSGIACMALTIRLTKT